MHLSCRAWWIFALRLVSGKMLPFNWIWTRAKKPVYIFTLVQLWLKKKICQLMQNDVFFTLKRVQSAVCISNKNNNHSDRTKRLHLTGVVGSELPGTSNCCTPWLQCYKCMKVVPRTGIPIQYLSLVLKSAQDLDVASTFNLQRNHRP